jgi:hypothetical protein
VDAVHVPERRVKHGRHLLPKRRPKIGRAAVPPADDPVLVALSVAATVLDRLRPDVTDDALGIELDTVAAKIALAMRMVRGRR